MNAMDIQSGVVGCGVFPTRLQVFVKVWTAQTRPAAHARFLFNPKVPNKNAKGGAPSRPVGVRSWRAWRILIVQAQPGLFRLTRRVAYHE